MESKKCSRCKELKPLEDFRNSKKHKNGKQYHCKPCADFLTRERRKANPEAYKEYQLKWREANKEKMIAIGRAWKAAHPEYQRQYYKSKKERLAFLEAFYEKHKDCLAE